MTSAACALQWSAWTRSITWPAANRRGPRANLWIPISRAPAPWSKPPKMPASAPLLCQPPGRRPRLRLSGAANERHRRGAIRRSRLGYTILRSAIVYGPQGSLHDRSGAFVSGLAVDFSDARRRARPHSAAMGRGSGYLPDLGAGRPGDRKSHRRCRRAGISLIPPGCRSGNAGNRAERGFRSACRLLTCAGSPSFSSRSIPRLPVSVYWLDYMAVNRTTALDTMPRTFNLMPARISQRLGYLRKQNWRAALMREPCGSATHDPDRSYAYWKPRKKSPKSKALQRQVWPGDEPNRPSPPDARRLCTTAVWRSAHMHPRRAHDGQVSNDDFEVERGYRLSRRRRPKRWWALYSAFQACTAPPTDRA